MDEPQVSNAFKIFGTQFEIGSNVVHQAGACLWPRPPRDSWDPQKLFLGPQKYSRL